MRLNYKVLWIDDREDWVDPIKESIGDYLEEKGLTLTVNLQKNGSGIEDLIRDPALDLIIIDYNLSGEHGDDLIKTIRSRENYTDIVFYSADENVNQLVPSADGIYRCHRDQVDDKIVKVIDATIRRSQDLTHMRGFVMAETIDIEVQIESMLTDFFGKHGGVLQKHGLNHLDFYKKKNFMVSLLKTLKKELLENNGGRPDEQAIKIGALISQLNNFDADVIEVRNTMAHVKKELNDSGQFVLRNRRSNGPSIEYCEDWCIQTRKKLSQYIACINDVGTILSTNAQS